MTTEAEKIAADIRKLEELTTRTAKAFERAAKTLGPTLDRLTKLATTIAPEGPTKLRDDLDADDLERALRALEATTAVVDMLPQYVSERRDFHIHAAMTKHGVGE